MYSCVYPTVDGRWAGPYESRDYDHPLNEGTTVKPEVIPFKEPVTFDITKTDSEVVRTFFPEPYYQISEGSAHVVVGNYVEDLFKLKRDGYLKARGLF